MSEQKPKKPFLKRGTRQFLSNATVRSLSQKPRIVEFTDDNFEISSPFSNVRSPQIEQKDDVVISVKPKSFSKDKGQNNFGSKQNLKKPTNTTDNKRQLKSDQSQQKIPQNLDKPIQTTSSIKNSAKKPTLLSDYLNNQNKSVKKPSQTNINQISIPKSNPPKNFAPSPVQSQAQQLRMQNIEDDSDEQQAHEKYEFANDFLSQNKKRTLTQQEMRKIEPVKKKPNLLQEVNNIKKQKQNLNYENQRFDGNDVKFDSDDSENDETQKMNKFKSKPTQNSQNYRFRQPQFENQNASEEEQNEQIDRKNTVKYTPKTQSKVTQMFNKNSKTGGQGINQASTVETLKERKMTIDDVPKELIEEIVEKYFKDAKIKYEKKQQNLIEQVKIVQKKQLAIAQQQKLMQKRLKEFQKQMEEKNRQFQSKVKAEQNKITRQKMYLKDQQTGNKMDWKTKNTLEEMKQQLEDQRNQRKRIQVKLKGQLDRLKARFNEQIEIKKNLQSRIKQYELRDIKQKQIKVRQDRQTRQEMIQKKKTFWDDAPKQSYLEKFYSKDFTLCEYLMEDYFYEHNEFYQYYKEKGETDILQVEEVEGNKIKRTYENGKIEIESVQKFVKQVFPWGLTIVHYINGDIKQVIQLQNKNDPNNPRKMEIYYAKNNQIIEFSISDGKRIHYFLSNDQIELNDELFDVKEIYNGKQLQRMSQGSSLMLQKNAKGVFVQLY